MNDMARHIRKRFPDKKQSIDRLMAENPEFLAVCEDYDVCIEALQHWEQSKEPEAKTRVNEYRTLIKELEEEISQALAALEPGGLD